VTLWTPHNWPNRPMTTRDMLDHVRVLLDDVTSEHLRDTEPIRWAKSVCALGKLSDDQRDQMLRYRVEYNLGKHQFARLLVFIEAWDEIGKECDDG